MESHAVPLWVSCILYICMQLQFMLWFSATKDGFILYVFRVTVGGVLPDQTSRSAGSIHVSSWKTATYVLLSQLL